MACETTLNSFYAPFLKVARFKRAWVGGNHVSQQRTPLSSSFRVPYYRSVGPGEIVPRGTLKSARLTLNGVGFHGSVERAAQPDRVHAFDTLPDRLGVGSRD